MIEDGHLHVILARRDTPVPHLHAMQDLVPKAVIIPLPPNEGITRGMELKPIPIDSLSLLIM